MAWHTGNMTRAAGQLKAVLDALVPLNAYWSLYDEPAANQSVYENSDPARNSLFYWFVDDSAADFTTVQLWEGWDAVAHAGTGQSLTVASDGVRTLLIGKSQAGYALRVRDHNIIYIDMDRYFAFYVGQLKRYDESKNMPLVVSWNSGTTTQNCNPLGKRNQSVATNLSSSWRFLFDSTGSIRTAIPFGDPNPTTTSTSSNNSGVVMRTSAPAGAQVIEETAIFPITTMLVGTLEGVVHTGDTTTGRCMANLEMCDVDGVVWIMIRGGGYGSVIEQA